MVTSGGAPGGGSVARALGTLLAMGAGGALFLACSEPRFTDASGVLSGQVVVSGPLRNAAVSVDQLEYQAKAVQVRAHLGDTTTNDRGEFTMETQTYSGLLLVRATGGSYVDLATGAVVVLDSNASIESIEPLDLLEQRDDALVSPVGHLIATRTRMTAPALGDVVKANQDAEDRLGRLAGNVPWTRIKLAPLDVPATSPTAPVRAAFVQAALSLLANDIAGAAGASPQEVNVLGLTHKLATDIADGRFDGDDMDSLVFGQGLQLGVCPRVAGCTDAPPPPGTCPVASCRPLCDLYSGTPRALLAGELNKVVNSPTLNRTGIASSDGLSLARQIADDADEALFGPKQDACVDVLDRLPPTLTWVDPTPTELAYKGGSFTVKATAVDDLDPAPRVKILGSDETAATAVATINSTLMPDGLLTIKAVGHDMAGNAAMIQRTLRVDNTVPVLSLDPANYLVDGATWWSSSASPTLRGTVTDASPVAVAMATPGGTANATVTGLTWTGSVAAALDPGGTDVQVTALDAAGNRAQVTQRIRPDVTPPELTLQQSNVLDEALEVPTFDDNEIPVHIHTGASIDLSVDGSCPALTRFSYLLAQNVPYGREVDDSGGQRRNPLHYVVRSSDDGVGIAPGSTQYRVGYRSGNTTTWLIDWTTVGTPVPNSSDVYDVKLYSDQIPQLATNEGVYMVDFRATDRLSRTTTATRCFDLHLRAPPLHFRAPGPPNPVPVDHAYRLLSLSLNPPQGGPFTAIAQRLLNNDATGASILDEDLVNGTASTIYLEVGVTRPGTVYASQSFRLSNFSANRTTSLGCSVIPDEPPPPELCHAPTPGPVHTSADPVAVPINSLTFPVRVFELDGNLAPAVEVGCLVCGAGDHWKFAIPPRSVGAPPRWFKIMTMIGQVSVLWPSDPSFPATPPFVDTRLNGIDFTGGRGVASEGCTAHTIRTLPDGTVLDTCTRVTTLTPYRALTTVHLEFAGNDTQATYATAPTSTATPVSVTQSRTEKFTWESMEGPLP